jgi:hypothetical protein
VRSAAVGSPVVLRRITPHVVAGNATGGTGRPAILSARAARLTAAGPMPGDGALCVIGRTGFGWGRKVSVPAPAGFADSAPEPARTMPNAIRAGKLVVLMNYSP